MASFVVPWPIMISGAGRLSSGLRYLIKCWLHFSVPCPLFRWWLHSSLFFLCSCGFTNTICYGRFYIILWDILLGNFSHELLLTWWWVLVFSPQLLIKAIAIIMMEGWWFRQLL
jgi:hypothetical protein